VRNDGFVVQVGTPRQIYEQPANQFVADSSAPPIRRRHRLAVESAPALVSSGDRGTQGAGKRGVTKKFLGGSLSVRPDGTSPS